MKKNHRNLMIPHWDATSVAGTMVKLPVIPSDSTFDANFMIPFDNVDNI